MWLYQGLQKLTGPVGISCLMASKNFPVSWMLWSCRHWEISSRHCWNPFQKYSNWPGVEEFAGSDSLSRRWLCRWCTVSSSMSAFSSFDSVSSSCRRVQAVTTIVSIIVPCAVLTKCTNCMMSCFSSSRHLLMRALRLRFNRGFITLRYW